MASEPESLILTILRRMDAKIDALVADVRDLKSRVTTLETQVGALMASEQAHYATTMERLDRIEVRLERVERAADLLQS